MDLAQIRREYSLMTLDGETAPASPFELFEEWMKAAILSESAADPSAMTLSTCGKDGRPSARIVLLKGLEDGRFVFYTNYTSKKGGDMAENPFAALTFFWGELQRQVRVEGRIERVSQEASDAYFKIRPRESQIGALSSPQSQKIRDRAFLTENFAKIEADFSGKEIGRPEHWGGYALLPDYIEFWQGRNNRLHDRLLYEPDTAGGWVLSRLAP